MGIIASQLGDILTNVRFAPMVMEMTNQLSNLVKSSVVAPDPALDKAAGGVGTEGTTVKLPYWNDINSDDDNAVSGVTMEPAGLTTGQDVAIICRRQKMFSAEDLAAELTGTDPVRMVATRLAAWWAIKRQAAIMSVLNGVFANNVLASASGGNDGDLVLDLTKAATDAGKKLTANSILEAAQLLGDAKGKFVAVAMNSQAEFALNVLGNTGNLYRPAETPAQLATYNGKSVIVDDMVPCTLADGVYTATFYLFAQGAIANNDVATKTPFEMGRDIAKSTDNLATRQSFIAHVRGIKWTGMSIAHEAPTNAELATAANWSRVWDKKSIKVVKLICNL